VDEEKPSAQIEAEIAVMPVEKIGLVAKAFRDTILKRRAEVADLNRRLGELKAEEQTGSDAAKMAKKITTLEVSDGALSERFALYVKRLGEKGGDTTGLSLP
jgi:hypothetical protein